MPKPKRNRKLKNKGPSGRPIRNRTNSETTTDGLPFSIWDALGIQMTDPIGSGTAKHDRSDYQGAIADYDLAISRDPDNMDARRFRGMAKVSMLGAKDVPDHLTPGVSSSP